VAGVIISRPLELRLVLL